jgi:uncharacterized ferritin-like protein (DUF455 family)
MAASRQQALAILAIEDPGRKCQACLDLPDAIDDGAPAPPTDEEHLPGRPVRPRLVPPSQVQQRSMASPLGRATLIHALAHIELNAVNLALDIIWRFDGMPQQFYRDWLSVAKEEALHHSLLARHLATLGCAYGDFDAHDGLWDMARRTRHDLLARLALVPRTLEARGLDASPLIRDKLAQAGDKAGADILDIILRDEVGHVAIGNHWFRWVCAQRGQDPLQAGVDLARAHRAPGLRGPFNLPARRAAGFMEQELRNLQEVTAIVKSGGEAV